MNLRRRCFAQDASSGKLAVVAVLFDAGGKPNEALALALEAAPRKPGMPAAVAPRPVPVPALAPPAGARYEHYVGSLTTPPCTEVGGGGHILCVGSEGPPSYITS